MSYRSSKRVAAVALTVAVLLGLGMVTPASGAKKMPAEGEEAGIAPVDLNRASTEQLIAIPGIGKVMAERIVKFREEHGPFDRAEDLLKIKGIGEKSFQKLRPYVKVSKSK